MSARGSTAKISSLSSMSPPLPASRVCTLTFILAFLALVGPGLRLVRRSFICFIPGSSFSLGGSAGFLLRCDGSDFLVARKCRNLVDGSVVDQAGLGNFELLDLAALEDSGRIGRSIGTRQLDRVGDGQPSALVARDRALDEQKAADRIRADHLQVLLSAIARTHVPGHLLVLEDSAWILAITGRTVRAVRNGNTVRCSQTAKAPALHRAGEALALRDAGDVDQ